MTLRFIPNALCILRMLLVIPVATLLVRGEYLLTLGVFAIAAVTDALDGFLAKRFSWTSELGKVLDPMADKLLLVTLFITLTVLNVVPLWLTVVVVTRDVIIGVGALAYKIVIGPVQGRPTPVSKLNTLCQILYLSVVFEASAFGRLPEIMTVVLGALVFVTTVVSGIDYVKTYWERTAAAHRRGLAMKAADGG